MPSDSWRPPRPPARRVTDTDRPAIGWKFVSWTGDPVACNVPACGKQVNSGHVRVDRPEPRHGDPVLCGDCYFKIMLGVDPDPGATVPEWEQRRREKRDPDA